MTQRKTNTKKMNKEPKPESTIILFHFFRKHSCTFPFSERMVVLLTKEHIVLFPFSGKHNCASLIGSTTVLLAKGQVVFLAEA